jgi:hypothetical protein
MTHNKHWEPVPHQEVNQIWQWLRNAGLTISKMTFTKWYKAYNMRIAGYEYQNIANALDYNRKTAQCYYFRAKKCFECFEKDDIQSVLKWVKWWGHYGNFK